MSETHKIKTGTTCIGMLFKDGVILAADRRVTTYKIESERFDKVFDIADRIVSTVAGMASDAQLVMRHVKGELKLIELKSERGVKVKEAAMLLNSIQYSIVRSQGAVVSLIVGGYDDKAGFELYDLSPDGTVNPNEGFVADGSGSLYVKSVLQNEYDRNISEKEAIALIEKCFRTSFQNDNASGGGYVAKVVTKTGIKEVSRKLTKTEFVNE